METNVKAEGSSLHYSRRGPINIICNKNLLLTWLTLQFLFQAVVPVNRIKVEECLWQVHWLLIHCCHQAAGWERQLAPWASPAMARQGQVPLKLWFLAPEGTSLELQGEAGGGKSCKWFCTAAVLPCYLWLSSGHISWEVLRWFDEQCWTQGHREAIHHVPDGKECSSASVTTISLSAQEIAHWDERGTLLSPWGALSTRQPTGSHEQTPEQCCPVAVMAADRPEAQWPQEPTARATLTHLSPGAWPMLHQS